MSLFLLAAFSTLLFQPQETEEPAQPARGNLGGIIQPDDYPSGALRRNAQGTVRVELTIGVNGMVSNCRVTGSSGDPDLDRVTCEIIVQRARYEPARDASGTAVADRIDASITWRLTGEGGGGMPFEAFRIVSRVVASPGAPLECQIYFNDVPAPPQQRDICAIAVPPGATAMLQRSLVRAEFTDITTFTPAGADAAASQQQFGDVLAEGEAEVTIGPDGFITGCRVLRADRLQTSPEEFCGYVRNSTRFVPVTDGSTRIGRFRKVFYRRVGNAL